MSIYKNIKDIPVNKDNYKQNYKPDQVGIWNDNSDTIENHLSKLSDEELKAQVFLVKGLVKGLTARNKQFILRFRLGSLRDEFIRRGIKLSGSF